jgi:hypothetical protein
VAFARFGRLVSLDQSCRMISAASELSGSELSTAPRFTASFGMP